MYSPTIVESNIARVVDAERVRRNDPKFRIIRFSPAEIDEMVEHLDKLVDKRSVKEDGAFEWSRDLTEVEQRFIDNEMILCQLDWRHWAENFCLIQLRSLSDRPEGWDLLDDHNDKSGKSGPLGKLILNGMQEALLQKMAGLEEIAQDQARRKVPVNGILLILLKSRQLGASTVWQSFIRHRVNFYSYFPALIASIDAQSTQSMQRRSERMWEHMPVWMRAKIKRKTIDGGSEFVNDSLIQLQDFRQQKDLGKGETWLGFHGTEISVVAPERAYDHFDEGLFHAVPHDRRTLFGMESTAKGKSGWWYEFCTNVMSGTAEGGAGRFDYNFAPFYLIDAYSSARGQRSKCRMECPPDWEPRQDTLLMAERVYDTSHLYMPDHNKVRLDREVLYWYEVTRQESFRKGKLNIFKQSYPIEPIDAFQHSASGAFTNETIDRMQQACAAYDPIPYRMMTADELPEVELYSDARTSPIHHVGPYHIGPMHRSELDDAYKDPRGVIWIYEQPDTRHTYAAASDPSGNGVPRWTRQARTHNDINVDNGTVQVWRKQPAQGACENCRSLGWLPTAQKGVQLECSACDGRGRIGGRSVQVVDFAAPVNPEELALYVFVLGRIYRGNSDLDECELIVNRIGVGMEEIRTLQRLGYTNLWQTEAVQDGIAIKTLAQIGFNEHPSTVPLLHSRGRLLLVRRDMEPRSKFLIKELSDAVVKTVGAQTETSAALRTYERFYVPPGGGRHDDRMVTTFLAGWILFPLRGDGDDLSDTPLEGLLREMPAQMSAMYGKELAGQGVSAADQGRMWNEMVGRMYEDQDLNFGHFADCSDNCVAEHGPTGEELALDEWNPYARLDDESADGELF